MADITKTDTTNLQAQSSRLRRKLVHWLLNTSRCPQHRRLQMAEHLLRAAEKLADVELRLSYGRIE